MNQHTDMVRKFCVALIVGGKEKYGKSYEFFKEKQQQELYHHRNSFSRPPTSNFLTKYGTEIFIFFLIIRISSVPNFFNSFAFETFWHKNVIVLADVFPISCQWKDISV